MIERKKPGISNLMTIYSVITGLNYDEIEKNMKEKAMVTLKEI